MYRLWANCTSFSPKTTSLPIFMLTLPRKNIPDESGNKANNRLGDDDGPRTIYNKNANVNANLARLMVRNDAPVTAAPTHI